MEQVRVQYAIIAGIAFLAACAWMYALPGAYSLVPVFGIRMLMYVCAIVTYIASFIVHLEGYVYLGQRMESNALLISARSIMGCLVFFMLALLASIFSDIEHEEAVDFLNGIVGISVALLAVPSLVFAISLGKMYKRFGPLALICALLTPIMILTMWRPWAAALVVALSVYFLSRVSNTRF